MHERSGVLSAGAALLAVVATGAPVVAHGREPDVVNLVTGLVLLVAGSELTAFAQTRTTGRLLIFASVAWFVPDLAEDLPVWGGLLAGTTLVHLAPLVAAVLVAPRGALVGGLDRCVVLLAVVAAASAFVGGYQVLVPAVGVSLVVAAASRRSPSRARTVRALGTYWLAVVATATALIGVPIARVTFAREQEEWLFVCYAVLLSLAATALVGVGPWLRTAAILDVGPDALLALDDLLVEATGDPGAHLVVRVDDDLWVRLDGRRANPPDPTADSAVVVARRPVPAHLAETISDSLRLVAENVIARRGVDDQVHELEELRARLVRVEEDQRLGLVDRLRTGPLATLSALRLDLVSRGASSDLVGCVRETERDVEQVVSGLDPLGGFSTPADAIRSLATELGASVEIDPVYSRDPGLDPTVARALWYVCAEAMTNSWKHAAGASRSVHLVCEGGTVVLLVKDDGPGPGAAHESGLSGVRDRVAALGGWLEVTDLHPGTSVEVRVPTSRQHVSVSRVAADPGTPSVLLASRPPTMEDSS
jgi:signal transduction histidine kinase